MALDASKWAFTASRGVRYIGAGGNLHGQAGANYVSVYELHRWLQDLADDAAAAGDDLMDITKLNPSDKKFTTIIELLNGAFLDDAHTSKASEYIYGGSIIQNPGGGEDIYDGINVVANRGVIVNVIQNNAVLTTKFWNTVPNGETFAGLNPDPTNGIAMRFLVKVKSAGAMIDNGALILTTREWGKTFSEFRKPATGRGTNDFPLTFKDDLNNTTVIGSMTSSPFTTVSLTTAGYKAIDVNQDTVNEEYYSEWNRGSCTINQFYETMKHKTRNGETASLYGLPGEKFRGITHSADIGTPTGGSFVQGGATPLSWGTGLTAGTGQILCNDSTDHILYIQLLTGVAPGSAMTVTQGAVSATTASAGVEKPLSAPFCGDSTGSSLVGAYGFALEYADMAVADKFTALDGVTRNPPNNVTFTVNGLKYGWRVLVGPENGSGGLLESQLSNTSLLNGAAVTAVQVDEAIPANTPATGTIRIQRANGVYSSHPYSAVNTGTRTFTITSHNFSTNTAAIGANVYIAYVDQVVPDPGGGTIGVTPNTVSFNTIQSTPQTLFIEARYSGLSGDNYALSIKAAKTTGALGSTGGSATISSVSDA